MAVRQCSICGFQLQPGLSQFGPYLFRLPASVHQSLQFICSIHFDKQCLTSVNNVWYLHKDSIPTLHLTPSFNIKEATFNSSVNKPGNSQSNIPNKQMEQSEKDEDNVSVLSSASSGLDGYPAMPILSLTVEDSAHPQNLNSRRRKLRFDTNQWSYGNETSNSSENDSPPPLSPPPPLSIKNTSLSPCLSSENAYNSHFDIISSEVKQKKKEKETVLPCRHRRFHQVSVPSVPRRSRRLKSETRKSTRRKTRPHRYCASVGECTCLDFKCTKKVKPSYTKLKKPPSRDKFVDEVHNAETETKKNYEEDYIDGFLFLSFSSSADLDKFCAEGQIATFLSSTVELDSYPSGAVFPLGVNVTESHEYHSEKQSTSFSSSQDKIADKKKTTDTVRKKPKSFPKVPSNCRKKMETLARLKMQNRMLRRRLAKALRDVSNRKLDQANKPE